MIQKKARNETGRIWLGLEEGKTALNLAFQTADANGCQYILANDPDADRLAVCQKVEGKWRIFSGNELGALIGWWMFKVKISFIWLIGIYFCKLDCQISNFWILQITTEKNPGMQRKNLHFINTTVSSKMLSSIAKIEGLTYTETLTGFKWMANKAVEIQSNAEEQVCSYPLHVYPRLFWGVLRFTYCFFVVKF